MSVSENQRRLEGAGYRFEPSRAGKHLWRQPGTEWLLPEEHAVELVRQEEERKLAEAGWEPVDGGKYWCRPDTGHLYPRGPAYDVLENSEDR